LDHATQYNIHVSIDASLPDETLILVIESDTYCLSNDIDTFIDLLNETLLKYNSIKNHILIISC